MKQDIKVKTKASGAYLPGLSLASLKQHKPLIPLFTFVGFGCAIAAAFTLRTLFFHPENSILKYRNPEPWNQADQNYRFKFYDARSHDNTDYKTGFPKERPSL